MKREVSRQVATLAILTCIWFILFLFSFFSSFKIYLILFLGYLCAIACNLKIFKHSKDKGRLNKIIIFYNFLGASVIFLRMLSGTGVDFTGFTSSVSHTLTLSHTLFEMFNFFFLQIFYPALFPPPILLKLKKSERILGKLENKVVKVFAVYAVFFILLASIPSIIMISSFSTFSVFEENYKKTSMKFGSKVNSFANEAESMGDWEELLSKEIEIARELGLDYMDFYIDQSYVEDVDEGRKLKEGIKRVKEANLNVILACAGSNEWSLNPPTLAEHNKAMLECALELAKFHPDYLIIFVEPIARHNGIMLKEPLSTKEWIQIINKTALKVKNIDEKTRVSITIAADEKGFELFKNLQNSNLDAIGIDVHPFHADMIEVIYEYSEVAEKEIWVFEFGMESYNFGEETQARYMSHLPKIASDLGFSGVVQYDIMDNPQSQMGLVYRNGERKLGFFAYKNAIERIRGKSSDFSWVLEEKQRDNGVILVILLLLFSYIFFRVLKKIKR